MKLQKCATCSGNVSANAPSCPHCGEPGQVTLRSRAETASSVLEVVGVLARLMLMALSLVIVLTGDGPPLDLPGDV